jgi:UDP-glucose 4-epimerase
LKKIAIIGANSYIARNVYYVLTKEYEAEIRLYDYKENQLDGAKNYKQINILDIDSIKNIDMDCDVIFMFVGKTGSADGFDDIDTFIDINERSLLNILNEYRRQGSKAKIIFPSTRLVYKGKEGLQKENSEKEFKTIYAINKYACEQYLAQYGNVFGVKYCVFRICIPYGTLIPNASSYGTAEFMLNKAKIGEDILLYGDGSVRRTLTYMGDLCRALIEGAFSTECINDIFNIGGENYSLKEMADLVALMYGVHVKNVDWPEIALKIESGDTVFDSEKFDKLGLMKYEMKFSKWCENQSVGMR